MSTTPKTTSTVHYRPFGAGQLAGWPNGHPMGTLFGPWAISTSAGSRLALGSPLNGPKRPKRLRLVVAAGQQPLAVRGARHQHSKRRYFYRLWARRSSELAVGPRRRLEAAVAVARHTPAGAYPAPAPPPPHSVLLCVLQTRLRDQVSPRLPATPLTTPLPRPSRSVVVCPRRHRRRRAAGPQRGTRRATAPPHRRGRTSAPPPRAQRGSRSHAVGRCRSRSASVPQPPPLARASPHRRACSVTPRALRLAVASI